jgi:dihydropteroate synthase
MDTLNMIKMSEEKKFPSKYTIDHSLLLNFGKRAHVMGIINVTADSFSGDGVITDKEQFVENALQKAHLYVGANADIIDIGGESTRPGALLIPEEEEITRVIPVIQAIRQHYSIPLSIDTTKAAVAENAFLAGANILNDVSGMMMDPHMAEVAIRFDVPVILMHMKFAYTTSKVTDASLNNAQPEDIVDEVIKDLERLTIHAMSHGIKKENIILDPGIGYGKNVEQNLSILKNLQRIKALGYPILMGVSRKAFIGYTTRAPVDKRLFGSIAASAIAVLNGADIIRVHDVAETVQAIQVADAIRRV